MNPILAPLVALLVSAIFAAPILNLLRRLKSRQTISEYVPEHAQKQGTPTMGGLIILVGLVAGLLVERGPFMVPALLLLFGFGGIGFVDDYVVPRLMPGKRGLGWKQKFALEIALAVVAVYAGGMRDWTLIAVATFVILFLTNAYNFVDGMDSMAAQVAIYFVLGLVPLALWSSSPLIVLSLLGAVLPFWLINAHPAKVFMGDVGALPIGALLGLQLVAMHQPAFPDQPSLSSSAYHFWPMAIAQAVLCGVMFAELVPVPLQVLSVKLTKKRLFPRTPIHHAFQHAGWDEMRVVTLFVIAQVVCSIGAAALYLEWVGRQP